MSDMSNASQQSAQNNGNQDDATHTLPDVIEALDQYGDNTIVTKRWLAAKCNRHVSTIEKAINRDELPPTTKFLGVSVWTIAQLRQYIQYRLDEALVMKQQAKQRAQKVRNFPGR